MACGESKLTREGVIYASENQAIVSDQVASC